MRKAKLGAQKYVGRRSRTRASPSAETVHDATKPSEVIGSSSSGSRTVASAARARPARWGTPFSPGTSPGPHGPEHPGTSAAGEEALEEEPPGPPARLVAGAVMPPRPVARRRARPEFP